MGSRALVSSLACALLMSAALSAVEANCKIKNDSSKKVIIIPVRWMLLSRRTWVPRLSCHQPSRNCYFKNPAIGHKKGPPQAQGQGHLRVQRRSRRWH
ncbi:hypothetical protein KP509_1Z128300 [Ceratopteris richardii]|nr:hypothetical protein KP509_1Z128300 [Ceratopteris richardii]